MEAVHCEVLVGKSPTLSLHRPCDGKDIHEDFGKKKKKGMYFIEITLMGLWREYLSPKYLYIKIKSFDRCKGNFIFNIIN